MEKVNNDDVYETCDDIDALLPDDTCEEKPKKKLTPAQYKAITFAKDTREVYDQSVEFLKQSLSNLLKGNNQNYEEPAVLLSRIITLSKQQKQIKEELDILRPLLKEALLNSNYKVFKKGVLKVFFLGKTVSVSTSKKSSSTLKFDEATFKKENPELWKQYCIKTYSGGCGGNLTIKDMSEKQLKECSKIDTKVKEVLPWAK